MTPDRRASIGVIGGGRMAAGIARVFAAAGCQVNVAKAGGQVSNMMDGPAPIGDCDDSRQILPCRP